LGFWFESKPSGNPVQRVARWNIFGVNFEVGLAMEDACILYGHLVDLTAIWYILLPFGIFYYLVYFSPFGYVVPRKTWQPRFQIRTISTGINDNVQ
jgi:hypothetical protein